MPVGLVGQDSDSATFINPYGYDPALADEVFNSKFDEYLSKKDSRKIYDLIIEKAKEIMLGTEMPEGVNIENYKKFALAEIHEKASQMVLEFIEGRLPVLGKVVNFVREKRDKFIQKYLDEIRDKKIKQLERDVGILKSKVPINSSGHFLPSSVSAGELPMEGGRKRKYKKNKKSKKKNKKSKKKTKKIKKTKRKN